VRRWRGRISSLRLAYALGLWVVAGLLIPASATALEHPFLGALGSAKEPTFAKAEGLAFDQLDARLLIIDAGAGTVSRWNTDGTPASFSALGTNVLDGSGTPEGSLSFGGPGEVQVAVDNSGGATDGNIYLPQFAGPDVVDVFAEDGAFLGQLTESTEGEFGEPCGVAVDPDGNLFVGDFSGKIHKYEPSGAIPVNGDNTANFAFSGNCTLAAGAGSTDGSIFPVKFGASGKTSKLDATTGEEKYVADPGPTTTVTVDPATGILFSASGTEVKEFDASGETEATPLTPIPGEAKVMGIAVDEDTGSVYVSREGNPHIEVWGPAVNLPKVTTEEATIVNGVITLHGVLDADEGPPATCEFQYVEVSAEGFKGGTSVPTTPPGPFSGADGPTSVSAQITDLPEAAFRFRLLCGNGEGSKAGQTLLFDTFEQLPGLPDDRAYEMVSPSEKTGEVIPPEPAAQLGGSCGDCLPGQNDQAMPMQATPDGNSVLYMGQPFTGGIASGPNEYIAPRTSTGWGIEFLSSPTTTGVYEAFSADLSRAVLSQTNPALSPQAPSWEGSAFPNLYLRESGPLQPLITEEPPKRDPGNFRLRFAAANAGTALVAPFEHVVFAADDALTEETGVAPEAPEVPASEDCTVQGVNCNLYEWVDGELRLVNVLPNETAAPNSVIGAGRMLADVLIPNVSHAISDDGSRIFWSSEQTGQVYVRIDGEETLEIPGPGLCKEEVEEEDRVCFLTASSDGSAVLLSDGQVYELNGAGTAYEPTTDLSEGQDGFEGILGAAEDLSTVYFVDTKVLPKAVGQENANGEEAEEDELNLYAWDRGELDFIGILLPGDGRFGTLSRYGAWKPSPSNRTAQVSPDGSFLTFMSLASLTGYDNRHAVGGGSSCSSLSKPEPGVPCRQVFVYSADSEDLSCASCDPTGQQPIGPSNLSLIKPSEASPEFRQPNNLSPEGNGRVFFESQDTLSPRDINGFIQDVYEWEPEGMGSCEREGGCVYLISKGDSPNDSMFLDSSEEGSDAFFVTRQQLLRRDTDQQLDLYDARIGGGFAEQTKPPCGGEGCPGPIASPPLRPNVPSAGFTGSGNPPKPKPKHCKKGFVKKHGKCVKKKPKKHQKGGSK
jgi:hypothetical protein